MERVLIAYYSFEGHTEKIAEEIASRIRQNGGEADLLRIRVKKEPPHAGMGKFMVGGWMALTQKDPGILNEEIDLDSYDRIFLGMPVWAGNAPGAIAAFIRKTHPQGKDFYLFAVSGGGDDKKTLSKTISNLQGNRVVKTISLQQGGLTDVLDAFVNAPVSEELLAEVQKYIDENYEDFEAEEATEPEEAAEVINAAREAMPLRDAAPSAARPREAMPTGFARSQETVYAEHASYAGSAPAAFELDEGFSELLFQLIDERGWKDADCYKKANVSKQVFSNIRSNPQYLPSKTTVLALAIALELDLDETKKLLERAGYAISHSSLADVIVEYFIVHKRYNIFEINQTLFEHDQKILGSK
ncbi:MAG: flavodoxin [Lachnospiraceae bacterium]|nr:flavodoxin [Lachnospiraceae bacterium]